MRKADHGREKPRPVRRTDHGQGGPGHAESGLRPGDGVLFAVRPGVDAVVLALGAVAAGGTLVLADPGLAPDVLAARLAVTRPKWVVTESLLYTLSGPLQGPGPPPRPASAEPPRSSPRLARPPPLHGSVAAGRSPGSSASLPDPWIAGLLRAGHVKQAGQNGHPGYTDRAGHAGQDRARTVRPAGRLAHRGPAGGCDLHLGNHRAPAWRGAHAGIAGGRAGAVPTRLPAGARRHRSHRPVDARAARAAGRGDLVAARGGDLAAELAERKATHTFAVPVHLDRLLRETPRLPGTLRYLLLGAAPAPPGVLRRAIEAGPEVLSIYAMTEALPIAIASAREKLAQTEGDLLGAPLPGVGVRIADDGELFVSGPHLAQRYLGEEPLKEVATGDLVRLEEGRLVLLGRKKDMILRDGVNIYPGLYEPAIAALPGVAEAAIVGLPDPETGDEEVVLAVIPDRGLRRGSPAGGHSRDRGRRGRPRPHRVSRRLPPFGTRRTNSTAPPSASWSPAVSELRDRPPRGSAAEPDRRTREGGGAC